MEGGEAMVGGSDHGAFYIFSTQTGVLLDVIQHTQGMAQTVAVREIQKRKTYIDVRLDHRRRRTKSNRHRIFVGRSGEAYDLSLETKGAAGYVDSAEFAFHLCLGDSPAGNDDGDIAVRHSER